MKSKYNTIEQLVCNSYNPEIYHQLIDIIRDTLNEQGKIFESDSFKGLGFLFRQYKNTCYDDLYPMVSISGQKNSINIYVFLVENDKYVIEEYKEVFGKSNVGKSCIRIKKLNEQRIEVLKKILERANTKFSN